MAFSLLIFLAYTCLVSCHAKHNNAQLVYQFPNGSWIENIAVRSNGDLVLTSLESPGYLQVLSLPPTTPKQIIGFEFSSTLGIVETEPDVFFVLSSDFMLSTVTARNSTNSLWKVDFNEEHVVAERYLDLPDATFLNGLEAYNTTYLLAADSALGVVWSIDLKANTSSIVADDPLMRPVVENPYLEGINGLHIRPGTQDLCFTNSQQYIFACIELEDGKAVGVARLVARPQPEKQLTQINWDDFTFGRDGNAYIATEIGNTLQEVSPSGRALVIAGDLNSTLIAEPTAAAFGRTRGDEDVVYVVTAGGFGIPVVEDGQKYKVGAQVVAVHVNGRGHEGGWSR